MTCKSLRFLFASTLTLSLALTGCSDDRKDTASATAGETNGTTEDEPTAGASQTSNTPTSATEGTMGDSGTTTEDPVDPTTTTTSPMPTCNDPEGQPINSSCTDASGCGCDTGKCFVVPALGGFCGECLVDADCAGGGCSVPNPIAGVGASCNMGEPGQGCMSDEVCADPMNATCGTLLQVPGIITVSTCGQCQVDADCPMDLPNCTPTYDVANFSGKLDCVADAAIDNNQGCSLEDEGGMPAGNSACKSGFCGEASVMGLLKLGICGECNSDADCPMGQQCTDPQVDLGVGALIGSVCM